MIVFSSFLAGVLRVIFLLPLILIAHMAQGVSLIFESLSTGCMVAANSLRSAVNAPYVKEWNKQIAELEEEKRLRTLRKLSEDSQ